MRVYQGIYDKGLNRKQRSVAIGIFDGVHRGHRKILDKALQRAAKHECASMVITFDPHPDVVLRPKQKSPADLMSLEHRLRYFENLGFDEVLVVHFDKAFSKISDIDFVTQLLIAGLNTVSLSVGDNFHFGQDGQGNVEKLRLLSKELGFEVWPAKAVLFRGKAISSTRIRSCVEGGDLKTASQMLGRPVSVYGRVIHGRSRGNKIGFPTANLDPHHEAIPPAGVYAARGIYGKKMFRGVIHIGKRPTFGDKISSLEVHFLNFKGNLYGRDLELIFIQRLRGVQKFSSPQTLAAAIAKDIKITKKLFY